MSSPTTVGDDAGTHARRRRPLEYQRNLGSDMSLMFFVVSDLPVKFPHRDQHLIRGLDAEALARVIFPKPSWLTDTLEYRPLLRTADADDDFFSQAFFSLNISLYNTPIVASEWQEQYFLMHGRVHPYVLVWDLDPSPRRGPVEGPVDYCAPALIIRDLGFQAIGQRSTSADRSFPAMSPVASFSGPVVGSGRSLLRRELVAGLGDDQLKCCGFVQLSTYIVPGNPAETPFGGFHPFQVFVMFPIHANPWTSLCAKMIESRQSRFQSHTLFVCTGKVVAFLDHRVMAHPPELDRDLVFIVVPDTWTFYDKPSLDAVLAPSSPTEPSKPPSVTSMASILSPLKRRRPARNLRQELTYPYGSSRCNIHLCRLLTSPS
ncbi:hypothetical protein HIM_11958 [Hirsutella minnesotensis 3608]|uniref:Uncharacterized protein n=1 Tax=Hirsutella minnesotensis 3608 TaxID=1043627 RepID=A0A0F7ZWA9_9HYPO|nr:hypothetical protein HIM_11958 [Hirsutella minnesotensis 3608]